MKPAVSLLVPVFNREELVSESLDAALAQTMSDLEVILVDGASTDATWEVCRRYAEADPRIHAFRETVNSGPVHGWWRCIQEASGTFATFLWSDDLIMPTFLERTIPALKNDDVAFAYTAAEIGRSRGLGRVAYRRQGGSLTSREFILGSLLSRGRYPVSPACALFRLEDLRRNFVMEVPGEPKLDLKSTGAGVDLLFYLLAASQRPRVVHFEEPLAFFRAHPGSISVEARRKVSLSYALTKCWYARTHEDADLIPTILAWHWLAEMWQSHRFVSPSSAVRQYVGLTTALKLSHAALGVIVSLATSKVSGAHGKR